MAILKVARLGHPVLHTPAEALTRSQVRGADVQRLIDDMIETMHEYDGVGLAAPQVHTSVRVVVIEVPAAEEQGRQGVPLLVLVNPVVAPLDEEQVTGWEGCLSLPDLRGLVPRFRRVRLEALDRQGRSFTLEAADFTARVIQHECDHLDGVTYVERMTDMKTLAFLPEFERFAGHDVGSVEE
jgi:peptide deformylase